MEEKFEVKYLEDGDPDEDPASKEHERLQQPDDAPNCGAVQKP